jgi:hypothetical protein
MTKCLFPECEDEECSRGLCSRHYQQCRSAGILDEIAPKPVKQCPECGVDFIYKSKPDQVCCSSKCGNIYRYHKMKAEIAKERPCEWCNNIIGLDRRVDARFCSEDCWNKERSKRMSDQLWEERSANRKPCLSCEKDIPEHKKKNSEYCTRKCKEDSQNLKKYNLTVPQYRELLAAQGGVCKICGIEECPTGRLFAVDHDHKTGKIRGLLCTSCNTAIGSLKDRVGFLLKAIDYLLSVQGD